MAKCFNEKEKKKVDLYYNDLYGLEESISTLRNNLKYYGEDSEDDYFRNEGEFVYLYEVLLKFYLLEIHFDEYSFDI